MVIWYFSVPSGNLIASELSFSLRLKRILLLASLGLKIVGKRKSCANTVCKVFHIQITLQTSFLQRVCLSSSGWINCAEPMVPSCLLLFRPKAHIFKMADDRSSEIQIQTGERSRGIQAYAGSKQTALASLTPTCRQITH